jgi:cell division protein FtsW
MARILQFGAAKSRSRNQKSKIAGLPRLDYWLLAAVGVLLLLGLMLVYSGSYDLAFRYQDNNAAYYLMRQIIFLALGVALMFVLAHSDYVGWRRWSVWLMMGALVLLIIVLLSGKELYGAQRTLLGGSVQPSEIAKLILVLYIADWLASKGDKLHDVSYGLLPFGIIIGGVTGLIVLQPDFGTAMVLVITAGAMLFMSGIELKQMLIGILVAVLTMSFVMLISGHSRERLGQYIGGLQDPSLASEQLQQAWLAMRMGGVFGVGLGNGLLKVEYLPLAHTDSIFAVAAIELGLVGVVALVSLYAFIGYRGYKIALNTGDIYGQLLAFGATTMIVVQALINVSVMTGVLPLTGITLPFISYGGSSLVAVLAAVGVLQGVYRGTRKGSASSAFMDRSRRNRRTRLPRASGR